MTKAFFLKVFNLGIRNAEFYADLKLLKWYFKNAPKEVISKKPKKNVKNRIA
jgi:hypothetical protein